MKTLSLNAISYNLFVKINFNPESISYDLEINQWCQGTRDVLLSVCEHDSRNALGSARLWPRLRGPPPPVPSLPSEPWVQKQDANKELCQQ